MQDCTFLSATRLIVGKDTENETGKWIKEYGGTKVLVHHDSGYVKECGLVDKVIANVKAEGIDVVELGGVVPNPHLSLVYEGIELCRKEKVDFILAVGGGSVIDSAKGIAMGVPYDGDVWDFYMEKDIPTKTVPLGVVLTMAATGSEASNDSVVTNEKEQLKRSCPHDVNRPVFAIENPELTMTLPWFQTASGIVDIMSHSMERYFNDEKTGNDLTDRLCEAIFHTCIDCGLALVKDPNDYDARANLVVAGSLSHNNLTGMGRNQDWSSHLIEHEMSTEFSMTHGAGLAIVFPAWMKYSYKENPEIFLKWATRVMGCSYNYDNPELTILDGIYRTECFFKSLGVPVRFGESHQIKGEVTEDIMKKMTDRIPFGPDGTIGSVKKLNKNDVMEIYKLCK